MKFVVIFVAAAFSTAALACFAPIGGPEYDSKIKIERLEDSSGFQVTVPRYMDDMPNQAEIILAYRTDSPGGIPIYDDYEVLSSTVQDKDLVARFVVDTEREGRPYIVVMWWPEHPGMCGIQANSGFIET